MNKSYFYVYLLYSQYDHKFYTGYTQNLQKRIKEHQSGQVVSTKNRRPLNLVYYEACLDQNDATRREKYLKTTYGKRYLKSRLKHYLTNINFTG